MDKLTLAVILIFAVWNLAVFCLYGIDKAKAKRNAWRIPEKTLLLAALFLGGVGAFLGMQVFRHKTKHTSFKILVPLFMLISIAAFVWILIKLCGGAA